MGKKREGLRAEREMRRENLSEADYLPRTAATPQSEPSDWPRADRDVSPEFSRAFPERNFPRSLAAATELFSAQIGFSRACFLVSPADSGREICRSVHGSYD